MTPFQFSSHLPNHDQDSLSVKTTYTDDLERQLRLERLSHFFDKLAAQKELIYHHLKELKSLQEEIKRLDNNY